MGGFPVLIVGLDVTLGGSIDLVARMISFAEESADGRTAAGSGKQGSNVSGLGW